MPIFQNTLCILLSWNFGCVLPFLLYRRSNRLGQKKTVGYQGGKVGSEDLEFEAKLIAYNLEVALAKDLSSLAEVRHVFTKWADGNLLVWIAIDNAESYRVRSQVYDKELVLMDGFPEISFDFNLIQAMGRAAQDLAIDAMIIYSRS